MGQFRAGRVVPENVPRLAGWMTCAEASLQLNVSPGRISQMVKAGKLGQPFRIGTTIVLQAEAVKQEFVRRLNNPRYKKILPVKPFPSEVLSKDIPILNDSLEKVASAYLSKDA